MHAQQAEVFAGKSMNNLKLEKIGLHATSISGMTLLISGLSLIALNAGLLIGPDKKINRTPFPVSSTFAEKFLLLQIVIGNTV